MSPLTGTSLPQNSNLVLTAETRTRDATEPSGEPETLWGRFGKTKMGDRVQYAKPEGLDEKKAATKKKCALRASTQDPHP